MVGDSIISFLYSWAMRKVSLPPVLNAYDALNVLYDQND